MPKIARAAIGVLALMATAVPTAAAAFAVNAPVPSSHAAVSQADGRIGSAPDGLSDPGDMTWG